MTALIIAIVLYFLIHFFWDLNKDNYDLERVNLEEKFLIVSNVINEAAFEGKGSTAKLNKRAFNLYKEGANQIILFRYSTGHLTIIWKYKYFQKEVVHEKQFNNVRNLSIFEQQSIGNQMVEEMKGVIELHQRQILGGI